MRLVYLLLLCACTNPKAVSKEQSATADDRSAHPGIPDKVRLTDQVIKDARIKIERVTKQRLSSTITLPGEITADPNKLARVSSPVQGRIERVQLDEGALVKKGDTIATLRVPEVGRYRSTLVAATAKASAARLKAQRLGELADKELGSKQAALDASAEAQALESDARAASEQMVGMGLGGEGSGSELVLRAPIDGMIVSRNAVVGQAVSPSDTIATVAQLDEVWFLGRVFEKDLSALVTGAPADVQLNAFPKDRFPGKIDYVGRQVDPIARTLTARIRLTNKDGRLRLGLFGNAYVAVDEGGAGSVIAVPLGAIAEIGGKNVVFVREADGDFVRHDVVLGRHGVGAVEIQAGLDEGEQLVTEGAFTLKSVMLKSSVEED